MTKGVEATTGPLGQGAANAVGMAMAEAFLAARFNRPGYNIVDHYTYALVSDGDIMEGVAAEAASLAGHLGLGKLVYLYDANDVTLDGPASLTFSRENVAARYEAYGWHVQTVEDGDSDLAAIDQAIATAKAELEKPSLIVIKTTIGFGLRKRLGLVEPMELRWESRKSRIRSAHYTGRPQSHSISQSGPANIFCRRLKMVGRCSSVGRKSFLNILVNFLRMLRRSKGGTRANFPQDGRMNCQHGKPVSPWPREPHQEKF